MLALVDALRTLGQESSAVPWTVHLAQGWSATAPVRTFHIYAPPRNRAIRPVLSRLHNAILLTNPASAALEAPIRDPALDAGLDALRLVHHVPIALGREVPAPPPREGLDLPARDEIREPFLPDGLAAGLDIGGTGMKACVMLHGSLVRSAAAPSWPDGEVGIDSLVRRARALLVEVVGGDAIGSLGIGMAAPMDVSGRVVELSTILREKVGDASAFDGFGARVAEGICVGPVAMFNDLVNLGRWRAGHGARRLVRVQIGTSFGGCWIDANGDVSPVEMGRLVVDVAPDAVPHTYLPIRGAMKSYLSNYGIARHLAVLAGVEHLDARTIGNHLADGLAAGDPHALATMEWLVATLRGVVGELHATLPGIAEVECGGGMLVGVIGRMIAEGMVDSAIRFSIPARPGMDGAIAAAEAPRIGISLRGLKRMERA